MKNRSGEKIKLASIDELLGVVNEESAMEIEISKIHPFKNHPFKVLDDEKMQDLVEHDSYTISWGKLRECVAEILEPFGVKDKTSVTYSSIVCTT